jgi:hypothetical protein
MKLLLAAAAAVLGLATQTSASTTQIPYPFTSTPVATSYSFVATTSNDVTAYFTGSQTPKYDDEVGLLVNGVLTSAGFGLNNQTSKFGQSFDFGHVNAGDSLTFVMLNTTLNQKVYSNSQMNVAYDGGNDVDGHTHIYAVGYNASSNLFAGVPSGIYVGFEDMPFPASDFDYNDETFVLAQGAPVGKPVGPAPEPAAWGLLTVGIAAAGLSLRARHRQMSLNPVGV